MLASEHCPRFHICQNRDFGTLYPHHREASEDVPRPTHQSASPRSRRPQHRSPRLGAVSPHLPLSQITTIILISSVQSCIFFYSLWSLSVFVSHLVFPFSSLCIAKFSRSLLSLRSQSIVTSYHTRCPPPPTTNRLPPTTTPTQTPRPPIQDPSQTTTTRPRLFPPKCLQFSSPASGRVGGTRGLGVHLLEGHLQYTIAVTLPNSAPASLSCTYIEEQQSKVLRV